MIRRQHPLIEGRFREAILKAERDVASTAAGNRGHEKPGTAAWQQCQVAWSLRAGPGNRDGGGTWADNATAERREAGLPVAREGPRLASVASRVTCATSSRLDVSRRSANSPRSRGRQRRRGQEDGEEPGGKYAPGTKKTALFDIVNRKRRGAMHRQGAETPSRLRQRARSRPRARLRAPPQNYSTLVPESRTTFSH